MNVLASHSTQRLDVHTTGGSSKHVHCVLIPRLLTDNFRNRCGMTPARTPGLDASGAGEVIVHRGPAALCSCRVKILGGKTRGCTWDYDQCYVRILDAPTLAVSANLLVAE